MDPFQLAAKQLGMNERDQRSALTEYLANGGVSLDPSVTAWCAAYVNATLAQSGQKGTGSNMARSFETWGSEVKDPQRGDLAVFSRGDPSGPMGHVGFFDGYNEDGTIRVLGGNQGDGVSISSYSPDQLLSFRRGEGGNPQNAFASMASQPQAPQNALAQPQLIDMRQDVTPFLRPTRNALALG